MTLIHTFIICSENQTFYDPQLKKWIKAQDISQKSYFLDYYGNSIPCIHIEQVQQSKPLILYEISLSKPHTFFVSKPEILTHNVVPIVIGLSWVLGEGVALTGAGVGLGALGLGVWQKFGKNKKITFAQKQQEYAKGCAGGAPDPDDDKNRKKNSISKTEFFEKIKDQYDHLYDNVYKKKNTFGINRS